VSKLTLVPQVLLNGKNIETYTDSEIYNAIAAEERRIADLEKINLKPKRLVDEINAAKAELQKLVTHLDAAK
jgi:hypothetical protein